MAIHVEAATRGRIVRQVTGKDGVLAVDVVLECHGHGGWFPISEEVRVYFTDGDEEELCVDSR